MKQLSIFDLPKVNPRGTLPFYKPKFTRKHMKAFTALKELKRIALQPIGTREMTTTFGIIK